MAELRPVGQSLQRLLSKWGLERQFAIRHALSAWEEIVGEPIARIARPLRLENATLWVAVRTHTWAQELTFHKATLLQRLNERVDNFLHPEGSTEPAFRNLRFVVCQNLPSRFQIADEEASSPQTTPADIELSQSEQEAIANSFADVADERLRTALIRARIASMRYEQWRRQRSRSP